MGFREIVWQNPGSPTFTRELPRSFPREFPAMSRHFPGRSSHAFSLKFPQISPGISREFPGNFEARNLPGYPGACMSLDFPRCSWGFPGNWPGIFKDWRIVGCADYRISKRSPGCFREIPPAGVPGIFQEILGHRDSFFLIPQEIAGIFWECHRIRMFLGFDRDFFG